jgi:C4-dicarboxylate-specific signal transduction histidine kinase
MDRKSYPAFTTLQRRCPLSTFIDRFRSQRRLSPLVALIRRDQERASEVIRRLRSLLRKAPFELREIDLNEVGRETIAIVSTVGRPVELRSSLATVPLPIRGDRIQLQQVILNLIMNAMDAMANLPSAERKLTVATWREDTFAELSVSDAGPGIAPDKIKEVFEPFFTTKENGMGMGLSISRTIVEAHNGQLLAENGTSGGATFRIRLPLASAVE